MSVIFLLFWTVIPNSTALVSLLFISKIHVLFMIIALLSRAIIAQEQAQMGSSAKFQSKSISLGHSSGTGSILYGDTQSHLRSVDANGAGLPRSQSFSISRRGVSRAEHARAEEEGRLGRPDEVGNGEVEQIQDQDPVRSSTRLVQGIRASG